MATEKDLWEGDFNWAGETYHYLRYAKNKGHARTLMIHALSQEKGIDRSFHSLELEFGGQKDNYEVWKKPLRLSGH